MHGLCTPSTTESSNYGPRIKHQMRFLSSSFLTWRQDRGSRATHLSTCGYWYWLEFKCKNEYTVFIWPMLVMLFPSAPVHYVRPQMVGHPSLQENIKRKSAEYASIIFRIVNDLDSMMKSRPGIKILPTSLTLAAQPQFFPALRFRSTNLLDAIRKPRLFLRQFFVEMSPRLNYHRHGEKQAPAIPSRNTRTVLWRVLLYIYPEFQWGSMMRGMTIGTDPGNRYWLNI